MRYRGAFSGQLYHTERPGGGLITYAESPATPAGINCNGHALIKRASRDIGTTYTSDEAARINSACADFPAEQIKPN